MYSSHQHARMIPPPISKFTLLILDNMKTLIALSRYMQLYKCLPLRFSWHKFAFAWRNLRYVLAHNLKEQLTFSDWNWISDIIYRNFSNARRRFLENYDILDIQCWEKKLTVFRTVRRMAFTVFTRIRIQRIFKQNTGDWKLSSSILVEKRDDDKFKSIRGGKKRREIREQT